MANLFGFIVGAVLVQLPLVAIPGAIFRRFFKNKAAVWLLVITVEAFFISVGRGAIIAPSSAGTLFLSASICYLVDIYLTKRKNRKQRESQNCMTP